MFTINLQKEIGKKSCSPALLVTLLALQAKYENDYNVKHEAYKKKLAEIEKINAENNAKYKTELQAVIQSLEKNDPNILQQVGFNVEEIKKTLQKTVKKPISIDFPKVPIKKELTMEQQSQIRLLERYPGAIITPEESIKEICKKYNLVFSPSSYFREELDARLSEAITCVQNTYNIIINPYKCWVVAPREMFNFSELEHSYVQEIQTYVQEIQTAEAKRIEEAKKIKKRDPIVFIEVGVGYYIPIWAWGSEFSIFRVNFQRYNLDLKEKDDYMYHNEWITNVIYFLFIIGIIVTIISLAMGWGLGICFGVLMIGGVPFMVTFETDQHTFNPYYKSFTRDKKGFKTFEDYCEYIRKIKKIENKMKHLKYAWKVF
jgi:hypothetical protein